MNHEVLEYMMSLDDIVQRRLSLHRSAKPELLHVFMANVPVSFHMDDSGLAACAAVRL